MGSAEPDLIHDLRIHLRRFCALSELLPWHEGDRAAARTLRKEVAWAMQPLSLARDWDVFLRETLPRLCEAEPDLDREAAVARALGPSRRLERHVKALTALQGALGGMQDLRTASRLGQEVCISLSTGKLARRSSAKASQRLLREADRDWRAARRRFMRQPAFWAAADHGKLARRLSGQAPG